MFRKNSSVMFWAFISLLLKEVLSLSNRPRRCGLMKWARFLLTWNCRESAMFADDSFKTSWITTKKEKNISWLQHIACSFFFCKLMIYPSCLINHLIKSNTIWLISLHTIHIFLIIPRVSNNILARRKNYSAMWLIVIREATFDIYVNRLTALSKTCFIQYWFHLWNSITVQSDLILLNFVHGD